jgi:histone H3/H4
MEELLKQLMKKAKQECEEAHRQYVAATNGLAAIKLLR